MPKNKSALISQLLKKLGIDVTDPKYMDLVNVAGEIGDEAYTEVENGINALMTTEQAKTNNEVRKHFRQHTLDPVDKELKKWLDESGYDADEIADILADTNTYTKLSKTLAKTRELEAKKAASAPGSGKKELETEITKLNAELKKQADAFAAKEQKFADDLNLAVGNYAMESLLSNFDYAIVDGNKKEAIAMVKPLITASLKEKNADFVFDKEANEFKLIHSDTKAPYHDPATHTPVKFSDFVSSTLAAKKVLKVKDDSGDANQPSIKFPAQLPGAKAIDPRMIAIQQKAQQRAGIKVA